MGIIVVCCCGKRLEVPDSAAGRRGKCSECNRTVFVPTTTDRGLVFWSGTDMQILEACVQQSLCQLPVQGREAVLDEAEKWAKAWRLPPEKKPNRSGRGMVCDVLCSCVQRDATVGMDRVTVYQAKDEPMLRVTVFRQEKQLLHFVARTGEDEYLCWHHHDAEDEAVENEKQRTDVIQALSGGVRCAKCGYNIGYVRLVPKVGLAPIVGYRCTSCSVILCSKCHGKYEQGCPECRAGHQHLQVLSARLPAKV